MQAPPQIGAVLIAHPIAEMYGSDRVMLETIEAAAGRGWAVHVTVPGPGPLVEEIRHRGATVSYDNTPVLRKTALRPRGLLRLITQAASGLFAGLRLIRSVRPAVIYVSTLTIPLWVVIGRLLRVPVLVHMHESERQAPRVLRRALAAPLLLAGRIVVNSDFSRSVLVDSLPTLGRRAQVLYNGVPGPARPSPARPSPARTAIDGPAPAAVPRPAGPPQGSQVAVTVVHELRDRGRDVRLDLVGAVFPGYEWFEQELRSQIAAAGLTGRVRLLGFQPDVWQHLANADVLLVPSQVDVPFGNAAGEAVLAGRPVVVSRGSGLDEPVRGVSAARRVDPVDAAAWADAVEDLLDYRPATRAQVAVDAVAAGRRFAPSTYRELIADHLDALAGAGMTG